MDTICNTNRTNKIKKNNNKWFDKIHQAYRRLYLTCTLKLGMILSMLIVGSIQLNLKNQSPKRPRVWISWFTNIETKKFSLFFPLCFSFFPLLIFCIPIIFNSFNFYIYLLDVEIVFLHIIRLPFDFPRSFLFHLMHTSWICKIEHSIFMIKHIVPGVKLSSFYHDSWIYHSQYHWIKLSIEENMLWVCLDRTKLNWSDN